MRLPCLLRQVTLIIFIFSYKIFQFKTWYIPFIGDANSGASALIVLGLQGFNIEAGFLAPV